MQGQVYESFLGFFELAKGVTGKVIVTVIHYISRGYNIKFSKPTQTKADKLINLSKTDKVDIASETYTFFILAVCAYIMNNYNHFQSIVQCSM